MAPKRFWPERLFRRRPQCEVSVGDLLRLHTTAWPASVSGPYRLRWSSHGQLHIRIVGMEASGIFVTAAGEVFVPVYRRPRRAAN